MWFCLAFSISGSSIGEGFQYSSGIRFIPQNRFSSLSPTPIWHQHVSIVLSIRIHDLIGSHFAQQHTLTISITA